MRLELSRALFVLPNAFTFSSILCGFYAILLAGQAEGEGEALYRAALLISFSMVLDTVDGRVARMTKTQSAFGVQIDSLADVISFGVAPAILLHRWVLQHLGAFGVMVAFIYLGCSAARLARFNILATDETSGRPKKVSPYILGLPTPAAAGVVVSLVVAAHNLEREVAESAVVAAVGVLLLSTLMVSSVRFRSFKDLRFNTATFVAISAILISGLWLSLRYHPAFALSWLFAAYVALALTEAVLRRLRPARSAK